MASWADNALTALERARQAQERHERRIDVQLRLHPDGTVTDDLGNFVGIDQPAAAGLFDLTLRCPTCGQRADMCFAHGDDWKKRPLPPLYQQTDAQLRAGVNEFTEDDPPPYA